MKTKALKILTSKQKGNGELLTNIFTVFVLMVMIIFFVDAYSDLKMKDNLDSVARKHILILETTSTINGNDILVDIDRATGGNGSKLFEQWYEAPTIKVIVEGSSGSRTILIDENVTDIDAEYGDIITLNINGQIISNTGQWTSAFDSSGSGATTFDLSKSSTAKH